MTEQELCSQLRDEMRIRPLKYRIETYGCQMNVRDSETIAGMLEQCGCVPAQTVSEEDILLFNTCCVRDHAEKRVFGNIGALKVRKLNKPGLIIGVCGCMMQQQQVSEHLMKRFPYVDLVFGTNAIQHLPEMLRSVLEGRRVNGVSGIERVVVEGLPAHRSSSVSAFVNIMYGCNNYCSYCIVPYVRGPERSRAPEDILAEVKELCDHGCTEITLLGQNVNSYGNGTTVRFPELLYKMHEIPGARRIRFMTSHPKDLSDELIDAIASLPNVCKHVHLPVQSGSDAILDKMNRRYTAAHYLEIVEKLRARIPYLELTTDIIVGFPSESDTDFEKTLQLVEQVGFSAAYTFKYSPRQGTRAALMGDQIAEQVKRERLARLNALQAVQTAKSNQKYVGCHGEILVEGREAGEYGSYFGKLSNLKMVYFPSNTPLAAGQYRNVKITGIRSFSLIGELEE